MKPRCPACGHYHQARCTATIYPNNSTKSSHKRSEIVIMEALIYALRNPKITLLGAREFRSSLGMSYDSHARCEAYDFGREMAHRVTMRRFED